MRIAIAQINSRVGDLAGNSARILAAVAKASQAGAKIVLTPELSIAGYPPEDLLLRPAFMQSCQVQLQVLANKMGEFPDTTLVVGHPRSREQHTFNCATVIRYGKVIGSYGKLELPNYAVFDEQRYFVPDGAPCLFDVDGIRFGINICEDVWAPRAPAMAKAGGAQVLLALNASPFHLDKLRERLDVVRENVSRIGLPVLFCNLVGGQDELVFDGGSFALNAKGELAAQALQFEEDLLYVDLDGEQLSGRKEEPLSIEQQAYKALMLGTRDYVHKNGFKGAVLGLSGGVDSALVLAIAADALGKENVRAVMMPSRFTSDASIEDASACAKALGVALETIKIDPLFEGFKSSLAQVFKGLSEDVTEENLQARIRGMLLMAISNKTGALVLSTGNKSEISVGYCTLYGDMAGGFSVIKDVVKGLVYRLCRERNAQALAAGGKPVIAERILTRAPTAELRENQTDQDSLPAYDALDDMIARYVQGNESREDLIAAGHPQADVDRVLKLIRISEYKRRQAAPGPRITPRAFGRDWRYPLTNGFIED